MITYQIPRKTKNMKNVQTQTQQCKHQTIPNFKQ